MSALDDTLQPQDHHCVRTAWLAAVLCTAREVDYAQYSARFFRTLRSYYRDLEHVAAAGIRFTSERNDHGHVVLIEAQL